VKCSAVVTWLGCVLVVACAAPTPEESALQADASVTDEASDDAGAPEPTVAVMPTTNILPAEGICPTEMLLVAGNYCPDARQPCKRWIDPPGRFHHFRCGEYGASTCKTKRRKPLRFCIDRDEYTAPGDTVPQVNHSWTTAKKFCEVHGKRLCKESEWQFACEGEEMRPYPYGFVRDATACNIDRQNITGPTAPIDYREPAGSHPRCVSPFGVRDMSGNIEEWATQDDARFAGQRSTMKGAWWLPGRNTCRAATVGHGEIYSGPQIGIRCCRDASKP